MSSFTVAPTSSPRWKSIAFWALRLSLALLLIVAGIVKLIGIDEMIRLFEEMEVGQWLRYVTALLEIAAAILLLIPATMAFGALIGGCIMIAATLVYFFILHQDAMRALIPAVIFLAIAWRHRMEIL